MYLFAVKIFPAFLTHHNFIRAGDVLWLKNIFNLCKQMSFTHTGKKSKFYSAQIFFSVPDLEHHQFDVFL